MPRLHSLFLSGPPRRWRIPQRTGAFASEGVGKAWNSRPRLLCTQRPRLFSWISLASAPRRGARATLSNRFCHTPCQGEARSAPARRARKAGAYYSPCPRASRFPRSRFRVLVVFHSPLLPAVHPGLSQGSCRSSLTPHPHLGINATPLRGPLERAFACASRLRRWASWTDRSGFGACLGESFRAGGSASRRGRWAHSK